MTLDRFAIELASIVGISALLVLRASVHHDQDDPKPENPYEHPTLIMGAKANAYRPRAAPRLDAMSQPPAQRPPVPTQTSGRSPGGSAASPAQYITVGQHSPKRSRYIGLYGTGMILVRDAAGHSTAIDPTTGWPGSVPDVDINPAGDGSWSVAVSASRTYFIDFKAPGEPFEIEVLSGLGSYQLDSAIRYADLYYPSGTPFTLTVSASEAVELKYDAGGDGMPETRVNPSFMNKGAAPIDTDPPELSASFRENQVTLTAVDKMSSVKGIWYFLSENDKEPHVYTGPFTVDRNATPIIYAYAEDTAGNRSGLREFRVP
ncbi:MAG TPA: hypothetical protein VEZ11_19145 [Thermoanaerobaculia bacterium]|nr:hypothetical protein [Thermoanaerobaculia bacterium]